MLGYNEFGLALVILIRSCNSFQTGGGNIFILSYQKLQLFIVPNNLGCKDCKEHQEIFSMSFFIFFYNFNIQQTLIHCKFCTSLQNYEFQTHKCFLFICWRN
jgi:hypothetical protein